LSAYAFTHDLQRHIAFPRNLEAGMVGNSTILAFRQPETPFGGGKDSGVGQESGMEGLLSYTEVNW